MPGRSLRAAAVALIATAAACGLARAEPTGSAVLEVMMAGRAPTVGEFRLRDGLPEAPLAAWRRHGVRVPEALDAATAADAFVSVKALPNVTARLDAATQTLYLEEPPDLSGLTVLAPAAGTAAPERPSDLGVVMNYDVLAQQSAGRNRHAALLDARLFGPLGVLEHSAVVSDAARPRQLRLNTTATRVDPARLQRWRVGDFVSGGLSWSRPVRLAGLQAMKDFSLRPDLVTAPTPVLGGTVAVPSTVDVLVNGVRQLSAPVEPGQFEVRQLPVVSGAGEIAVVVRDALGRETVQSLPFYAAPRQLAPGLSEFSVEAGRVRRNFGLQSDDYGPFAAGASLRRGLTQGLTLEGHAETSRDTTAAGGSAVYALPRLGVATAHAAASGSRGREGGLAGFGGEHQGPRLNAGFAVARASAGYRDIAATQGEPVPRRSLRMSGGVGLGRHGTIGAAWVDRRAGTTAPAQADARPVAAQRVASGSYSRALGYGAHAFVSVYRSMAGDRAHGVSMSLALPFGPRGSASAAATHERDGGSATLQAQVQAVDAGDTGWRLQAERGLAAGRADRQLAEVDHLARFARLSAAAEQAQGEAALRLGAQGSLVWAAGGLHAGLPVSDSLAVVELPGLAGVAVYRENRLAGRTDARGRLLVPDLLPYQPNRISIDPLDLPLDADVDGLTRDVRPVERSGVTVRYGLQRSTAALVVLHDASGGPVPLGAVATARGSPAPLPVGHDGQIYLRGLVPDNEVTVAWAGGGRCTARFALAALDRGTGRIGPVRCE